MPFCQAYLIEWSGGLYASELVERLREYDEYDAREICLRRLNLPAGMRSGCEERIERFLDMMLRSQSGANRAVPFGEGARRMFDMRALPTVS